ncbi:hypothetical protein BV25DRAFT_1820008 [Artomyces pyxidatus]|uniref:Uncharacterized protein n=1 Tax=Artomyces pyxidatus TaxID=48021 RepID=A0ACB8TEV1_9AGAM|nr:hypothetical protein BV25DRAFT_1820008 [Artomyces pyxidatus]
MSALETQLETLRVKKTKLLASHALINRMPPEILSRIFELGVYEYNELLPNISLVSRHWRLLALATPSIWSYIRLDNLWGYTRHSAFVRKLKVHIERSQACTFLVDIDCRYLDVGGELHQIMTELAPHLGRCFSFRVSVPDWQWMDIVKSSAQNLGPLLEELYLRLDPSDTDEQTPFTLLSQPCPRLFSVTLEHAPLILIRTEMPALRTLDLLRDQRYSTSSRISISFKELVALLTSTPTLEELRIQSALFLLEGSEFVFNSTPSRTTFPHLRLLSFNYVDSNNLALFLEAGHFPKLTRLSVQMDSSNDENMQWLGRLALESDTRFGALRQLDLRSCNIDGAALVPFVRALHLLPRLTALGLSSPPSGHIGPRIFEVLAKAPALELGGGATWLLPNLQALCVQNCRDISGHELMQVVWARNAAGAGTGVRPIRYLKIAQCYGLDPDVHEQLRRLVATVRVLC